MNFDRHTQSVRLVVSGVAVVSLVTAISPPEISKGELQSFVSDNYYPEHDSMFVDVPGVGKRIGGAENLEELFDLVAAELNVNGVSISDWEAFRL